VTSLPKDIRLPVVLFYYDGMSIREISAATGLTAAAVKTRLCRARKKLREKLTERSNEDEQ
jgi:RNA polymerase sigma-70 factor (ECF subfamily)